MPSSDVRLRQAASRKPGGWDMTIENSGMHRMDTGSNGITKVDIKNTTACIFKRGGVCMPHGCKGDEISEKKWCAKDDGS